MAASEGHRDVLEPPHDGGGVAVDHQQGHGLDADPGGLGRGQQHPGQRCHHEAEDPSVLAHPVGRHAGHGQQFGVVDHGPEGVAGAGGVEEGPQGDGHGQGHSDDEDLLVLDVDPHQPELTGHHVVDLPLGGRAPHDGGHAGEDDHQSEGHHDRPLRGGPVQAAHQDPLHQRTGDRGAHDQDDQERHQHRHLVGRDQLPVAERRHHSHRALGEVEDARGGVGHHQAGGGDGVPGSEHDPEDGVLQEVAHRSTPVPRCLTSHPPGRTQTPQDAGGVMYL